MNRYAFADGNPISFVELDGHRYIVADGVYAHSITGKIVEDRSSSSSGTSTRGSGVQIYSGHIGYTGSSEDNISTISPCQYYAMGSNPNFPCQEVTDPEDLQKIYDFLFGSEVPETQVYCDEYGCREYKIFVNEVPFVGGGTVKGAVRGGSALIDKIGAKSAAQYAKLKEHYR